MLRNIFRSLSKTTMDNGEHAFYSKVKTKLNKDTEYLLRDFVDWKGKSVWHKHVFVQKKKNEGTIKVILKTICKEVHWI